jgi:hypothetical protein
MFNFEDDAMAMMELTTGIENRYTLIRDSIAAVPTVFAEGYAEEVPAQLTHYAGVTGRCAAKGARIARCVVLGARISWAAVSAHWTEHGAEYRTAAVFLWSLLFLCARDALGEVDPEEFAALGDCPELEAVKTRVQSAAVTHWHRVRDWVWVRLVAVYRVWLDAVLRKVEELLGYAPLWVQGAVLR